MAASSQSTKEFVYEPLPPDHVRLIALWGVPLNGWPRGISCRFEVHHIDDLATLEYDAVSYAWDNQSGADETVNCYGGREYGTIPVTKHLWDGLASVMRKAPSLLCWIDALCINQGDVDEKQHQIPLMSKIYGLATNVVVWLGDVPEEDQAIINTETILVVGGLLQSAEANFALPLALMFDPAFKAFGDATKRMERKCWFRRSWVCQEVILAQQTLVLYGRNVIPWQLLYELGNVMQVSNFNLMKMEMEDNDISTIAERYNSLSAINELCSAHRRAPGSIRTSRIIDLIRNTSSTNLSDKVYCVLGLLDPEIASRITVDYNKHYTEVYLEFARAVVTHDTTLSLLANTSYLESQNSSVSLPSWCPDLSRGAPDIFSFLDFEYSAGFEDVANQKNRVTLLPGGRSIEVPGFRLGVVKEIAEPRPDMGVPTADLIQQAMSSTVTQILPWIESIQALVRRAMEPRGYSEAQIQDATWRVQIAGAANAYLTPDPEDPGRIVTDYLQAFYPACDMLGEGHRTFLQIIKSVDLVKLMAGDAEAIAGYDKIAKELGIGAREMQLHEAWVTEFRGFAKRRIFSTENGFVGMGPTGIQAGDVVCVLFDCSPVIVLRPRIGPIDGKGFFVSVGDAYVYGCMEFTKTDPKLKERKEDFVIG